MLSWLLILTGSFFAITAAVGLFRLPDFFTRIHAAGVTDTSAAPLILIGLMLNAGFSLVSVKLMFILILLWFTSPIASHCLANAARHAGHEPVLASEEDKHRTAD